jgi:hypothetical protein
LHIVSMSLIRPVKPFGSYVLFMHAAKNGNISP